MPVPLWLWCNWRASERWLGEGDPATTTQRLLSHLQQANHSQTTGGVAADGGAVKHRADEVARFSLQGLLHVDFHSQTAGLKQWVSTGWDTGPHG